VCQWGEHEEGVAAGLLVNVVDLEARGEEIDEATFADLARPVLCPVLD
jgi:hypothetical protein